LGPEVTNYGSQKTKAVRPHFEKKVLRAHAKAVKTPTKALKTQVRTLKFEAVKSGPDDKERGNAPEEMKKKLADMRSAGISKHGEFSFENLVFKELRNRGVLDKMNKYEKTLKDRSLSLK
jgi:hypothetical protein